MKSTTVYVMQHIFDSPKTKALALALGATVEETVGHLGRLWSAIKRHSPQGRLTDWRIVDVADRANWPEMLNLAGALVEADWLTVGADGVLVVSPRVDEIILEAPRGYGELRTCGIIDEVTAGGDDDDGDGADDGPGAAMRADAELDEETDVAMRAALNHDPPDDVIFIRSDLPDSPRLKALSERLGIEALGVILLLWGAIKRRSPDGRLVGWSASDVARGARWNTARDGDDDDGFVAALVSTGWLDKADDDGLLVVGADVVEITLTLPDDATAFGPSGAA